MAVEDQTEGTQVVETLKRLNTGGMVVVSWGKIIVGCVVFVVTVAAYILQMKSDQQIESMQRIQLVKSLDDFKGEIRGRLDKSDAAVAQVIVLTEQVRQLREDNKRPSSDEARIGKLESDLSAYNFNMAGRLGKLEAESNMRKGK